MVRHYDERIHEKKQMFGGEGEAVFHRILNGPEQPEPGEVIVPGTMLQGDTLPPKATLG